jgi:DNA-binding response OmpR family regulator
MKTTLIVDGDLGFVFWLGQGLDRVGYAAFPARSVPAAQKLVEEFKITVDLLIINPALADADEFTQTIRGANRRVAVVAVYDNEADLHRLPDLDLRCQKPERIDESTRQHLILEIERVSPPFRRN